MENETKKPTYLLDPALRRKGLMNSVLLAFQFGVVAYASLSAGQNFLGVIGVLATIGTINDALTFYYANKEK